MMSELDVLNSSIKEPAEESSGIEVTSSQTDALPDICNNQESLQADETVEESVADNNERIESDHDDTKQKSADKTEQISRELKLLLELSKEANLDTNITYKRNSLDPNGSPSADLKRSMRSQNPDFLAKHQSFLSRVSHGGSSDTEERTEKDDIKKRKRENSVTELIIGGAIDAKTKKLLKPAMALIQNNKDGFCWRCHKDGVNVSCETCPRSYHQRCLRHMTNNSTHWICPECVCILKAESTKTRAPAMKDMSLTQLCTLLKYAHKRMVQCNDSEPFIHPVSESEFPDYKKYIVHPMDLTKLEMNIMCNTYGSTNAFEADAKWILHNSIIFNSYQSKLTSIAKAIVKVCKQEMGGIQNCATCYLNANTKKLWFVEVCPKPHILVWAKLKGFPYWPAKAMSTNQQGMVDVRFFGAHDRAWVPYRECYLFTKKDPNSNNQKKHEINECIKELEQHIDKLKEVYGEVNFPPYRTPYEPDSELAQLRMFLPSYKPNEKNSDDSSNALSMHRYSKVFDDSGSEGEEDREVQRHQENRRSRARSRSRSRTGRQQKNKTPVGTGRPKTPKTGGDSNRATPNKLSRRNSDQSMLSDSSRVSLSSDKCSKADDDRFVSDTSLDSVEQRKKPPDERRFSVPNVVKISDKLMKKLSKNDNENSTLESESQPSLSDIKQVILGDAVVAKPEEKIKETVVEKQVEEKEVEEMEVQEREVDVTTVVENVGKTCNKENTDINNTKKNDDDDDKTIEQVDDLLEEMYSEVIDDQQLNGAIDNSVSFVVRKRKRSISASRPKTPSAEDALQIQKKLVRLVDINIIKNTKGTIPDKQEVQTPSVSLIQKDTTIPEDTIRIKSEPTSPDIEGEENAKREYLSALNILEKPTEKNITVKNKPTQRARKSFPKPSPVNQKISTSKNLKSTPAKSTKGHTSKKNGTEQSGLVFVGQTKQVNLNNISGVLPPNQTIAYTGTISNPIFNMVQHPTTFTNFLVSTPNLNIPAIMSLGNASDESQKKSQPTSTITKPISSSSIKPISTSLAKPLSTIVTQTKPTIQTNLVLTTTKPVQTTMANTLKSAQTTVINALPASKPILSTVTSTLRSVPVSVSNTFKPIHISLNVQTSQPSQTQAVPTPRKVVPIATSSAVVPPLCSLSASTTTNSVASNTHLNALLGTGAQLVNKAPEMEDFTFFTAPSDRLLKALTDVTCRLPPALKPKPPGPLTANTDAGQPSSAGAVTNKVNGISHKLTDYFRSMLVELLAEFGTSENQEALITSLKLENEKLKLQHQQEVSELKKNLQTILKEVEKNYSEDCKRLVDESRSKCEEEAIRRVDEARMKQWCANCKKEARFYCCWNTSYCDYPCQIAHWPSHMDKCTQNSSKNDSVASPKQLASRKSGPPKALPGSSLLVKSPKIVANPVAANKQLVNMQPGSAPKVYSRRVITEKP